jgi:hypothetical protein
LTEQATLLGHFRREQENVMRSIAATATAACLLLLAACGTTGGVAPPPVGMSQMEIEPGRVRVTYRGPSSMSEAEVRDRALLAAAEAALTRGYDWFRIVDRWADIAPPTTPRFSFGIGTGSYGRSSGVGVGASTSTGGGATFVSSLELVGGRGARPSEPDAYDARSVSDTLRRQLPPR